MRVSTNSIHHESGNTPMVICHLVKQKITHAAMSFDEATDFRMPDCTQKTGSRSKKQT